MLLSSPLFLTLASVFLVSFVSLSGVMLFALQEKIIRKSLLVLVGFSAGALLGDVFIHMLPEMVEEAQEHPFSPFLLMLAGMHNFLDGALIAGSYLLSPTIGIATTVAVVLHEIPQEIGDFAVLLYSGFSTRRAVAFNLLSAVAAFAGAILVLSFASPLPFLGSLLLPIAAGNFLYIAGADLMPELHKETRLPQAALQFLVILLGLGTMQLLTLLER